MKFIIIKRTIIISLVLSMIYFIRSIQEDYNLLIETYVTMLNEELIINKDIINQSQPGTIFTKIDNNWKSFYIDALTQQVLHTNVYNYPSYAYFREVIITSFYELYVSTDPKAFLGVNWAERIENTFYKAEQMFHNYKNNCNFSHMYLSCKLIPIIIPFLHFFNLTIVNLDYISYVIILFYISYIGHRIIYIRVLAFITTLKR